MTTRKAPEPRAARPTLGRSAPKRAKGAPWPDTLRLEVLERLGAGSTIADEHRATGVPKGTLSGWAKRAGVDLGEAARARTRAATERVVERVAEVKATTVDRLERILEAELEAHALRTDLERALSAQLAAALAGDVEDRHGEVFRLMRGESAATVMLRDPDSHLAQLVAALELLNVTTPKRDTVGAWTRANHDLALLKGEATERGDVVVRFGIPRPDTSVVATPESDLGRA